MSARQNRRGGAWRVPVVALLAAVGAVVTGGTAHAAPRAALGACPGADGVTVVVDFGAFNNGVQVACAPGDPSSGFAALTAAGFAVDGAARAPSFLCRINGLPSASQDRCVVPPPATAYWSYWIAPRGGAWCYSDAGMLGRDPAPGTVEGWSFVSSGAAPATQPPRGGTYSPVTGGGALGRSCDTATTVTTARPAGAAPTGTAPARPGAEAQLPAAVAGGTATPPSQDVPAAQPSGSGDTEAPGGTQATPAAPGEPGTAAPATTGSPTTEDGGGTASATPDTSTTAAAESEEARSSVALADSARSGPAGPLGAGVAVGAIGLLAAGAFALNRRRLAAVAGPPADADS